MKELTRHGMTVVVGTYEAGFARDVAAMVSGRGIDPGGSDALIPTPRNPRTRPFFEPLIQ